MNWIFSIALIAGSLLVTSSTWASARNFRCDDRSIVLGFAGDILVHNDLYKSILPRQSFLSLWQKVIPLFKKSHYMVANLEGPAALGIDRSGRDNGDVGFTYDLDIYSGTKFSFNFHPQILFDLKNSSVDLITTANNHSLDRRWRGVDRTLEAAREAHLATSGTRHSQSSKMDSFYHIAQIEGYRVAFVSCTETTNGIPDTLDQVLKCFDSKRIVEKLTQNILKNREADVVIVLPHWGPEYKQQPSPAQELWGKRYLQAGASAVIGSHPHVLQPLHEDVDENGKKQLIAYSLGNFLAYQSGIARKTGAVLYLKFSPKKEGQLELVEAKYSPTIREGLQVLPIDQRSQSGGFAEAAQFLGASRYLAPQETFTGCSFLQN